jgi:predicted metal-dependent enzyme (double-stranded beta helix superfamily)
VHKEFADIIGILNTIGRTDYISAQQRNALAACMIELNASKSAWLPDWAWTTPQQETVRTIFKAPGNGPFINIISWQHGYKGYVHNHNTWGLVTCLQGVEENLSWGKDSQNKLYIKEKKICTPGDVLHIDYNDIHSVSNISKKSDNQGIAISLHIYGADLQFTDRLSFDRQTSEARPNANTEFKNAEMYLINKDEYASYK